MAIVLVMYGHSLAPWLMDTHGWFSEGAFLQWKLGASFLMPLFFLLSGLSWREEKTIKVALREALTLIITAWMASVFIDFVRLGLTYAGLSQLFLQPPVTPLQLLKNAARMAIYGDFYSLSALWFLSALALTRLLATLSIRLGFGFVALLAIVLIGAGLGAQAIGLRNYHQIYLLGVAFSCFMAGRAARDAYAWVVKRPAAALALGVVGAAIVFPTFGLNQGCTFDMARRCGIPTLNDEFGVAMIYGAYGNLLLFTVSTIGGILWGLGVSTLTARYAGPLATRFNALGRSTLNLLIVNAVVLDFINPQVQLWIAPKLPAHGFVFFLALCAVAVATTLIAAWVLRRPVRLLRSGARQLAQTIIDLLIRPYFGWSPRRLRVSPAHEP